MALKDKEDLGIECMLVKNLSGLRGMGHLGFKKKRLLRKGFSYMISRLELGGPKKRDDAGLCRWGVRCQSLHWIYFKFKVPF